MDRPATGRELLFQFHGVPPIGTSVSLALQHLVAMIVGCVTPPIMIASAIGLSLSDQVLLIQASLVMSAVCTLLQLYPIGGRFGSGLPVILGVSFAYVPSMQAIAASGGGVAAIAGAMIVGGIVAVLVGLFVKKIRLLFPPVITGTVVFTIGLSLYPTAINYMAGGTANTLESVTAKGLPEALAYGSWQNWLIAALTLAAVLILNNKAKGLCRLASILIGMLFGYVVALCFGMVSFADVGGAAWFSLPRFMHFGVSFDLSSCVAIGLLFAINSIQAIGDFTATTVGGMNREPTDKELQGGIVAYGVSNILTALFGGLPTATYSQNVGIVTTNKVVNRTVFALTGAFLLLAGLSPKFAAVLTTIPQCVLGGATITVFSTIAMTGMKLIASQDLTARNTTIVGLSAALGVGISQASASLSQFPDSFTMIFGKSPVVIATIMAVLLNLILPKDGKH
ncbi:uracil-xanthine permease family protein [Dysosmobacter sp.]|uniref:uracil-xanthine permease family protein n=1 Tax=Dysosmobacter sp. TaxID=2591382 RepID=UPI001BB4821F|nr:nucleobase:cation symporter-2 family protein [Dysosmobacter sp.]MCI6055601.1 purine permease [Dysosmobacter sp.]MDY5511017.1 nucleobase:cation symporter-2 family protein [Dysosmobacter sp.]QUO36979.1 purine permease [Dysosmobacter sp. Marseille-Q4140]